MSKLLRFDFKQYKTLKQSIIKYQINEKFVLPNADSFLPGYKRKSIAQLQQKIMQVSNERRLKVLLVIGCLPSQIQKFQHHRIFDNFSRIRRNLFSTGYGQNIFFVVAQ